MKKPAGRARTRIEDLAPRLLQDDELLNVAGGEPAHDCTTGSGDTCDGDDCGPIPRGSHCGP